eukprot:708149-Alexandrium_andersonii.AAC.1
MNEFLDREASCVAMDYDAAVAMADEAKAGRAAAPSSQGAASGGVRGGASFEDDEAAAAAYHAELSQPPLPLEALPPQPEDEWADTE